VPLPETQTLKRIFVGVGWDIVRSFRRGADLDVSVVFFGSDGCLDNAVYFDNTYQYGVSHSGDNLTGEGDGDDEVIQVELLEVPENIQQIFVCVNCYTKNMSFDAVPNAYCRVVHESGHELLRYSLDSANHRKKPGLVMCRFMRVNEGNWGFEATGRFCGGRTWMDPSCVGAMKRVVFLSEMKSECSSPYTPRAAWGQEAITDETEKTGQTKALRDLLPDQTKETSQEKTVAVETLDNTTLEKIREVQPRYGIVSI